MTNKNKIIEQLFEQNFNRIYRYFYFKVLSKEIAEDLTSESFLAFVDKFNVDSENINSLQNYLYGIANNVFNLYLKKKYKSDISFHDIDIIDEIKSFDVEKIDLSVIALKFIKKLPEKQREIAHLRLIEKKSPDEISKIIKKDKNYIKTTQRRAIESLRKLILCTPPATKILKD